MKSFTVKWNVMRQATTSQRIATRKPRACDCGHCRK